MREVVLDGFESSARDGRVDVVGVGNAAVHAAFLPGCLLATKIALHPWYCYNGPDTGPGKREGPSQLRD